MHYAMIILVTIMNGNTSYSLLWFGHVERKEVDNWVSACRNLQVAGSSGRGRPRLTWRARLDGI